MAADSLGITPRTLDTFIRRARVRYANAGRPAPSKTALVKRAIEDGLITPEELHDPTREE